MNMTDQVARAAKKYEDDYFNSKAPWRYPGEHYAAGMNAAFNLIREQIDTAAVNKFGFPILHLIDYLDKMQGRKPTTKMNQKQ